MGSTVCSKGVVSELGPRGVRHPAWNSHGSLGQQSPQLAVGLAAVTDCNWRASELRSALAPALAVRSTATPAPRHVATANG